jgi:hypothetical protein
MPGIENKYYQVPGDGVDSQPITGGRWIKVAMLPVALVGGSCLVLFCIMAASTSSTSRVSNIAAESTNLVGLSPFLRSAVKPRTINTISPLVLPGSIALQKIAISAIEANNLRHRVRDISMMAEAEDKLKDELSNADGDTKATVAKVEKAVMLKAQDMAGVTAPLGFWDPVGFSTDIPEGKLRFYREVELKHGRVAMLASLGILVAERFHPLFGGNIDVPSYVAFQQTPLQNFWPAVVAAIAIPEVFSVASFEDPETYETQWSIKSTHQPGDFGWDPLGLKPQDPQEFKVMQTKELNNGRLAMIAAAGMIAQEAATGQKLF